MLVNISRREEVLHDFKCQAYDHQEKKTTLITCVIIALYCVPGL